MRPRRLLTRISEGHHNNVSYGDLVRLVKALGFEEDRSEGSHRMFRHPAIPEKLNLQSERGEAKPYQVKQLLDLVENYDLQLGEK